jgi:uncharacterized heparinase superfamily protein
MCIVIDLRKTAFVSLIKLRLHTILPTVLTVDPSARVTTLLALAAIGVKSTSCLAIASSQKLENKQPVSMRQSMLGGGGHRSYRTPDGGVELGTTPYDTQA